MRQGTPGGMSRQNQLKLIYLTILALAARKIEGKTPEDLTEEEKLKPLKNKSYARKRKELKEKEKLKSVEVEAEHRSVDDLLKFINGENGDSKEVKAPKNKKKKSRSKDQQKNAPPMMKSYIWLQTADGSIQQVEQEVAIFCPFICHEIHAGVGSSETCPISLPARVNPVTLSLILDYCRFHQVAGPSNKEPKSFDEKFIGMDTNRLCELTSAADSLQLKPLVDLTSRALARMNEGKTDDPRIRLLNRLNARKKELKEKEKLKLQDSEDEFDDCDDIGDEIDPKIKEQIDREVEDFAQRLNSDWPESAQQNIQGSTGLEKHEK